MSDIDYSCLVVEDSSKNEDATIIVNNYYANSDICEMCMPTGGTPMPDYITTKEEKSDTDDKFYTLDYTI